MSYTKRIASALAIVIGTCGQAFSAPVSLGLEVVDLNAQASSVTLPSSISFLCNSIVGIACPQTGDISISKTPGTGPIGSLNQTSGEGRIFYPARINFPLLGALGRGPVDATLVGSFFTSVPDSALISFDMGFINDPFLGRIVINNNNKDVKNVSALLTGAPGTTVNGFFSDITQEEYDRLERHRLRDMMDFALAELINLYPLTPAIDASVLDIIKSMYDSAPATELILYFPDAAPGDQFRVSQLTGVDSLALTNSVPETGSLALVAIGFFGLMVNRRFKGSNLR